jgi:hypothetical protein
MSETAGGSPHPNPVQPGADAVPAAPTDPSASTMARAIATAIMGVVGAACFAASLVMDWKKFTIDPSTASNPPSGNGRIVEMNFGLVSNDTMGLAYVVGVLAMLAFVGAVVGRAQLITRYGWAAAGVTGGLMAILIAFTVRSFDSLAGGSGVLGARYLYGVGGQFDVTTTYQPGLFFAYGAVLLLMLGVALSANRR